MGKTGQEADWKERLQRAFLSCSQQVDDTCRAKARARLGV